MAVSMTALFRLACLSFCFGAVLYLALAIASLLLRVISPSTKYFPSPLDRHLPEGYKGRKARVRHLPYAVINFFKDFFACLFCGISFIIFLFWQADGIPRLFAVMAACGGAYVARFIFGRFLRRFGVWIEALIAFVFLWISIPLWGLLRGVFSRIFAFGRKFALFFIKRVKRIYTIRTARKYAVSAERRLRDKAISSAIREAILGKEKK